MSPFRTRPMAIVFCLVCSLQAWPAAVQTPGDHAGRAFRLLVRVDSPADHQARTGDERPAEVILNFPELLGNFGLDLAPDLQGLRMVRFDPDTGQPVAQGRFAYGAGAFDIPWRWYDASTGYAFPKFEQNINATGGALRYTSLPRFGYYYDCVGDWREGHLTFASQAAPEGAAWYAVYFNLLPPGAVPQTVPPRGFLGDGLQRCEPEGQSTTRLIHSRLDVADWDEDGLFDLVAADTHGVVRFFRQAGPGDEPKFEPPVQIGKLGGRCAPCATDWNGDGRLDVVAASSAADAVVFLGRAPGATSPFEEAKRIPLPQAPYGSGAPVVVVDYNGDGDQDILLYNPYGYLCFYKHSFLASGYAQGEVVSVMKTGRTD